MSKRKGHVNALSFGLMGAAVGFMQNLKEGFETARAQAAKDKEMQELRAMALEDRAQTQDWHQQDREDTQTFNAEQRKLEAEASDTRLGKELGARASISAADNAAANSRSAADISARSADRKAASDERIAERSLADPITAWRMADGTTGSTPWSQMPRDATPVQIGSKNQFKTGPGQIAPAATGFDPSKPFDPKAFVHQYGVN